MLTLTKPQRMALKRIYDRGPVTQRGRMLLTYDPDMDRPNRPLTYRQFRTHVEPMAFGGGCAMLPWQGMWLGIEPDGYTHS